MNLEYCYKELQDGLKPSDQPPIKIFDYSIEINNKKKKKVEKCLKIKSHLMNS